MNENVFADEFMKNFWKEEEFIQFLNEREKNSFWKRVKSNELRFYAIEDNNEISNMLEKNMKAGGKEPVLYDTLEHTRLVLKVQDNYYPIRNCAVKTILERARISGNALNKVEKNVFAKIINYCIKVASGEALIRFCEDKISAVHGGDISDYAILDMPELFKRTVDYLKDNFSGYYFAGASYDHYIVTALWMLEDEEQLIKEYKKSFEKNGILTKDNIQIGLRLTASDVGLSGANLYPMLFYGSEFKNVPLGSPLKLEHKNKATMSNFDERLNMLYAQYSKALGGLNMLMQTQLLYPENAMLGIMKKIGIPKKYAFEVTENFKLKNKTTCSAYEAYLGITELLNLMQCDGESGFKIVRMEENIARAITLRWKDYDIAGLAQW